MLEGPGPRRLRDTEEATKTGPFTNATHGGDLTRPPAHRPDSKAPAGGAVAEDPTRPGPTHRRPRQRKQSTYPPNFAMHRRPQS
eukprot:3814391-Pyramimonas_sp.AAC.1